ncbi:cell division protein ZapA [Sphingomonas sp. ID0503]|uniref:cell division protein ZapA n=1 Tax=Sphingomonas sp. ID0503 TaxID=3399691 RepID=UPI003AFABFB7
MADVTLSIGGREYRVACAPGGESRLERVGAILDDKVRDATRALGEMGEARAILFAAILLGDELLDHRDGKTPAGDPELASNIERMAERIEAVAAALEARAAKP